MSTTTGTVKWFNESKGFIGYDYVYYYRNR
jgi:hypothetical protein